MVFRSDVVFLVALMSTGLALGASDFPSESIHGLMSNFSDHVSAGIVLTDTNPSAPKNSSDLGLDVLMRDFLNLGQLSLNVSRISRA